MRASPLDIEGRIEALLSSIKAGDIKPVYLLYGEEGYLIEETKERMVKLLLPDETLRDFNLDLLGGDFEERDLIGLVETYPVMAERRVVLLKDPGFMMEKEAGPFVSYFERRGFPEWTSIVMSFIESEGRKVERDSPAFLLVRKYGEALEFPPFSRTSERDMEVLFRIVSSRLEGKRVSKEAFIKAVELVGTDLRLLISELSKAGDFSMGSGSITAEDLESVSSLRIAEERTFDLLDAISNGDVGGAIFRAQRLLEDGEEPIFILYSIGKHLRLLMQGKALSELDPEISRLATFPYRDFASRLSSYLKEKALGEVGIGLLDQHPYVIYKVLGQAKRMRKRTILEILRDLEDTDSSMKSGRGSQEISLLLFLARSTERIHSSSIPF
jgi:DNA polymerase-3 subunit delta